MPNLMCLRLTRIVPAVNTTFLSRRSLYFDRLGGITYMQINIDGKLDRDWFEFIARQVDYYLARFSESTSITRLDFSTSYDHISNKNYYCCAVSGNGRLGSQFKVRTKNTDGKLAIIDTLSRVRREIIRNKSLSVAKVS